MDIYVDVVILENLLVNLFLLIITYRAIREKFSFKKAVIISFICSLYSLSIFLDELKILTILPIQILVAYIMCLFPLKKKNFKTSLKCLVTYLSVAFILGGICLKFMVNSGDYKLINGVIISDFKFKDLVISVIIIFIALDRITTLIREKNIIGNFIYEMEFIIQGEDIKMNAFLDTGNELREPITNLPCILVEEEYFKNIKIPKSRSYYIPYRAIGYESNLVGIKVERVSIRREGETWREISAIICPCKEVLSKENKFNALLSRGVI